MEGKIKGNNLVLENQFLKKELFVSRKRIVGSQITNKLSGSVLSSDKGEEFLLHFRCGFITQTVACSELKAEKAEYEESGTFTILCITFKSFNIRNSEVIIKLFYELSSFDRFCKKYVDISFAKKGDKDIVLDYIELSDTRFSEKMKSWCLPKQKDSHISGFAMGLGQPCYVDSFFFGCEFPACLSTIEHNTVSVRIFSGRTLQKLARNGSYKSYKYVWGVSESDIFAEVQKSFYSYIKTISKPVRFRTQYNSWYDNMLNINKENVYSSFLEIDKGLTKYGTKALDCFVADDGWNDYSKKFWCFNGKFPHKLTPFAELSENLGSRFGVWLGPRGGYTNDTIKFAKQIEKGGNGYVNKSAREICVASDRYCKKTGDLLLSFIDEFHLNYFKLDGFAKKPCKNKKHDHMTGGYKDMYFYTDLWEKWIDVFQKINQRGGSDFWINLTCYAPPSPWLLQYVNSIWMQISDDIGFIGRKGEISDKDRTLNYRDERYFDFYKTRQFQLPQRCVYNHDPIYGNEAKISMTDSQFREYLFTMATRGTAFWELYYSHSMMNEAKWRINRAALSFVEENMEVLSNSLIFGGRPSLSQIYGYSCFTDYEGIVCLRNSADREMSYTLNLDEEIGVSRLFSKASITTILPYTTQQSDELYSYGDNITVTLKPFETRIFHFNRPLKVIGADYVRALSGTELEVSFNQFINAEKLACDRNPIESVKLLDDYMTAVISFKNSFEKTNSITLKDVSDIMGNSADINLSFDYYENNLVVYGISGTGDFSVKATLEGEAPCVLMQQGDEVLVEITDEGYVRFRVGIDEIISRKSVKDVVQVTAVRERNGVMKLYLNGVLDIGRNSLNTSITEANAQCYDPVKVKIFNKALSFDEV